MNAISTNTLVSIAGLTIGLIFGAVVQRTNFCAMGGISDYVLMGDGRRLRAWVLGVAIAIIGSQALGFAGIVNLDQSIYLTPNLGWLGAILGGLMFGFGMTQAGGCASKNLVRLGSGNLKSLIVVMMLGFVAYTTLRGIIALPRVQLETTNLNLAAHGIHSQNIGAILSALLGIPRLAARAGVAIVAALVLLAIALRDAAFRGSGRDILAGLVVGLATVAGWLATGVLGADEFNPTPLASMTFVAPSADSLQYVMTYTGSTINFGIATVGGVILGSFLMSLATGSFHIESFTERGDLARHLGGAALMGAGGVMALGCTIGQGVTGMSTLSLGSLIAWLSIMSGGVIGIKYLEEGTLGGALRATFSRG